MTQDRYWINALLALDPTDLSHARVHYDYLTDINRQRYYRVGRVYAASGVSVEVIRGDGGWAESLAVYSAHDPDQCVRTIPA